VNASTHVCQSSGDVDFDIGADATLRGAGVAPFTPAISRKSFVASLLEMP
jgi:hypothetical protein